MGAQLGRVAIGLPGQFLDVSGADRPARFMQSFFCPVSTERFHNASHDRIGRVGVVVGAAFRNCY